MDKLKALFKRIKDKGATSAKTDAPTPAAAPKPTPTDTAAAPSTSDPVAAPAGK